MENNTTQSQQAPAFINEIRVSLSKDKQYLLIFLPGNLIVRKPINFFKAVMNIPFSKKTAANE